MVHYPAFTCCGCVFVSVYLWLLFQGFKQRKIKEAYSVSCEADRVHVRLINHVFCNLTKKHKSKMQIHFEIETENEKEDRLILSGLCRFVMILQEKTRLDWERCFFCELFLRHVQELRRSSGEKVQHLFCILLVHFLWGMLFSHWLRLCMFYLLNGNSFQDWFKN